MGGSGGGDGEEGFSIDGGGCKPDSGSSRGGSTTDIDCSSFADGDGNGDSGCVGSIAASLWDGSTSDIDCSSFEVSSSTAKSDIV